MSPEQVRGEPVDARSDIFSFGTILYELLAGTNPFRAATSAETMTAILRHEPPPLSEPPLAVAPALSADRRALPREEAGEALPVGGRPRLRARDVVGGPREPGGAAVAGAARSGRGVAGRSRERASPASFSAPRPRFCSRGRRASRPRAIRFTIPPPRTAPSSSSRVDHPRRLSGRIAARVRRLGSERRAARLAPGALRLRGAAAGGHGGSHVRVLVAGRRCRSAFFAETKLKRLDLPGGAPVFVCDVSGRKRQVGDLGTRWRHPLRQRAGRCDLSCSRVRRHAGGDREAECVGGRDAGRLAVVPAGRREVPFLRARVADGGKVMLAEPGPASASSCCRPPRWSSTPTPAISSSSRRAALLAQRFDARTGQAVGRARSRSPSTSATSCRRRPGLSPRRAEGTLAFQPQDDVHRLVWFDRTGRELGTSVPAGKYHDVRISRDGRPILFDRAATRARHVRRLVVRHRAKRRDARDVLARQRVLRDLAPGREERPLLGRAGVESASRPAGPRNGKGGRGPARGWLPDCRRHFSGRQDAGLLREDRRGAPSTCGRCLARGRSEAAAAPRRDSREPSRTPSLDSRPTAAISRSSPASPDSARPT